MKVVFTTLYLGTKPTAPFIKSLEECLPVIEAAGWEHSIAIEENCPYISAARAKLIRKALDAKPDVIVFLDYDVSWTPEAMLKLLNAEGDVVAGTYRFKSDEVKYMGALDQSANGDLISREDGALKAYCIPAGFLKVSVAAINAFAKFYPQLLFGPPMNPDLDMFNHGVIDGVWMGEDYAFSKRWRDAGGDIWLIPDLDVDHNSGDKCFKGNYHTYLKEWTP